MATTHQFYTADEARRTTRRATMRRNTIVAVVAAVVPAVVIALLVAFRVIEVANIDGPAVLATVDGSLPADVAAEASDDRVARRASDRSSPAAPHESIH